MRSDWPHPSFAGRFLPLRHEIGAQGFSAELRSAFIGLGFGIALAALYAMLYALLKAEDYSLLGGSLLLFGLLAVVMIATRRVDWYGLNGRRAAGAS